MHCWAVVLSAPAAPQQICVVWFAHWAPALHGDRLDFKDFRGRTGFSWVWWWDFKQLLQATMGFSLNFETSGVQTDTEVLGARRIHIYGRSFLNLLKTNMSIHMLAILQANRTEEDQADNSWVMNTRKNYGNARHREMTQGKRSTETKYTKRGNNSSGGGSTQSAI